VDVGPPVRAAVAKPVLIGVAVAPDARVTLRLMAAAQNTNRNIATLVLKNMLLILDPP